MPYLSDMHASTTTFIFGDVKMMKKYSKERKDLSSLLNRPTANDCQNVFIFREFGPLNFLTRAAPGPYRL